MRTAKTFAAAALTLLLAAACGSTGGLGDILGGGSNQQSYDIRGTVDSVDTSSRSIFLTNVSGYTANLNTGGSSGNTVRVYYDEDTTVVYQGRNYRPQDLERGDEVMIRANTISNGQLVADSMTVTYNAQGAMTSGSGSTIPAGSVIHGTVRSIDTYNRTLTIDRGFGSNVIVSYSANTPVHFNNRTYAVSNLEVGDEIDIRTTSMSGGTIGASEITVTRSISGTTGGSTSSNFSTIRGTVRSVDTYNRTITLENSSWISGFQSSTSGNLMTIRYDTNTRVDYQGQLHPITNLERGDVIDVQVSSASNLFAQRIFLVRDVNSF